VISAVVLAAGSSTRMGRPKLLLPLAGRPIVQHVVDTALGAPVGEIVVVLGSEPDAVRAAIEPDGRIHFTVNERSLEGGQSTSLRAGLEAVQADADAAVILLADQPGVSPSALDAVLRVAGGALSPDAAAIQASYSGIPAHPTLFLRSVWGEVVEEGDHGARNWIRAHPDRRVLVEVGGEPPEDVDTPEDYERVRARFESAR
jgi:molybdenum cofactor cytidylyltransferase